MSNYHNHRKNTVANAIGLRISSGRGMQPAVLFVPCLSLYALPAVLQVRWGWMRELICEAILDISLQEIQILLLNRQLLFFL